VVARESFPYTSLLVFWGFQSTFRAICILQHPSVALIYAKNAKQKMLNSTSAQRFCAKTLNSPLHSVFALQSICTDNLLFVAQKCECPTLWVAYPNTSLSNRISEVSNFAMVDSDGNALNGGELGLLLYNNGTICDDNFDDNAANAICQYMG
jgi:hypothetical protein